MERLFAIAAKSFSAALHIDQQSAPIVPGRYPIRARASVAGSNTRRPPRADVLALRSQPRRPCRLPRSNLGQQGRVTGLAPPSEPVRFAPCMTPQTLVTVI